MLMSAFRPCRQLPDASFADVAASAIATCNWGEIGAGRARSLADTLLASCAQRPASAYFALGASANNAVAFSLLSNPIIGCREPRRQGGVGGLGTSASEMVPAPRPGGAGGRSPPAIARGLRGRQAPEGVQGNLFPASEKTTNSREGIRRIPPEWWSLRRAASPAGFAHDAARRHA